MKIVMTLNDKSEWKKMYMKIKKEIERHVKDAFDIIFETAVLLVLFLVKGFY